MLSVSLPPGMDAHSPEFLSTLAAASLNAIGVPFEGDELMPDPNASEGHDDDSEIHRRSSGRGSKGNRDSTTARSEPPSPAQPSALNVKFNAVIKRISGPLTVIAMIVLISFETHSCFAVGLPWFNLHWAAWLVIAIPNVAIAVRIFYDYAMASLTDPGRPTEAECKPCPEHAATGPPTGPSTPAEPPGCFTRGSAGVEPKHPGATAPGAGRWCVPCRNFKPQRCHHCSVCDRCVLVMDHHCIFTNCCIGVNNRRHFFLFLIHLLIGLSFPVLILLPQVPECVIGNAWGGTEALFPIPFWRRCHVLGAFGAGVVSQALLFSLFWFHVNLLLRNETTLESLENWIERRRSCFDKGALNNFCEVFGPLPDWVPRGKAEAVIKVVAWVVDDSDQFSLGLEPAVSGIGSCVYG